MSSVRDDIVFSALNQKAMFQQLYHALCALYHLVKISVPIKVFTVDNIMSVF